jgi:hypothetical protein
MAEILNTVPLDVELAAGAVDGADAFTSPAQQASAAWSLWAFSVEFMVLVPWCNVIGNLQVTSKSSAAIS